MMECRDPCPSAGDGRGLQKWKSEQREQQCSGHGIVRSALPPRGASVTVRGVRPAQCNPREPKRQNRNPERARAA